MTEQAHRTQRAAAQSSLTRLCKFLTDNGHPIEGLLEKEIDTIHRALVQYDGVTKTLGEIQAKIQNFFNER